MQFDEKDAVVWLDIVPNQFAEFGRAIVQRLLEGEKRVTYYGMFRKEQQKGVINTMESEIFTYWDSWSTSPPQSRPRTEANVTISRLNLMSFSGGRPGWPEHIMNKFRADSAQRKNIEKMREEFLAEFGASVRPESNSARTVPRVSGAPDFTVDGAEPLDINRVVDLAKVQPPAAEERQGSSVLLHM